MRILLLLLSITFLLASCVSPQPSGNEKEILDSLINSYWEREIRTGRAYSYQNTTFPDHLYKGTKEEFEDDSIYFSRLLFKLKSLGQNQLDNKALTDYDLVEWIATIRLEATQYYDITFPNITPYSRTLEGPDFILNHVPFKSEADLSKYITLLKDYVQKQKVDKSRLVTLASNRILLPKPEVALVIEQLKGLDMKATSHSYYVSSTRLTQIDSTKGILFQQDIENILNNEIIPQYNDLREYLGEEYIKSAPESVGLSQYPGGKEYYRHLVRWHTTTDLTPEAIHELGKGHVATISKKLDSIRIAVGYNGSMKDFYQFLRTDKRFLAATPDEVGNRLRSHINRMDKVVSNLISLRPKATGDVRRLPEALEPSMTFGYYKAPTPEDTVGVYFYNGSKLDQRSLVSAASVALHEIEPGHHWQFSLQIENDSLHAYRKNSFINAFTEGWGEYASNLGVELNLYDDPYDYCGRLLMDMFLSVRLVVDTGMNYFGWTREQATEYMSLYLIESPTQISTETLRYSCDIQGQSLGYKIGSLKLMELRNKYKTALGDQFDVVKFHDTILQTGSLPLEVLEKTLDRAFGLESNSDK
ncbi:MAG: DUF885 domain-containing protein [Cyclobacteriaceae bacterium]